MSGPMLMSGNGSWIWDSRRSYSDGMNDSEGKCVVFGVTQPCEMQVRVITRRADRRMKEPLEPRARGEMYRMTENVNRRILPISVQPGASIC